MNLEGNNMSAISFNNAKCSTELGPAMSHKPNIPTEYGIDQGPLHPLQFLFSANITDGKQWTNHKTFHHDQRVYKYVY